MVSLSLVGCNGDSIQKGEITMEAFSDLKTPAFKITPSEIQSALKKMGKVGKDTLSPQFVQLCTIMGMVLCCGLAGRAFLRWLIH